MVNETFDIAAPIFDLNFDISKEKVHKTAIQRSSSSVAIESKDKSSKSTQQDLQTVAFDTLPKSTENLSWKFFEQVSSVDNQLRNDEPSTVHINGCQLMTSPRNSLPNDHVTLNGHIEQLNSTGTFNKSNGYMPGATKTLSSQHSPDLIQQQPKHATFQFTSPTATFKRKKQQQQQHQQQHQHQQHHQINNNYNSNNKNQLHAPHEHHQNPTTPCKSGSSNCIANPTNTLRLSATPQQQQKQQQQQERQQQEQHRFSNANDDDFNDVATTAMISNTGVIINTNTEATATGISTGTGAGTTHSFKTRTLPAVSVVRATYAADTGDDDEISKPIHKRSRAQERARRRRERSKQHSMGATLQHSADSFVDGIEQHVSLIGWRKKCLYTLLTLLLVLVVINLILTLWILKVMEFSPDGMGLLKIVPGGIQLTGQAVVMDMLRASTIRSRYGQPLAIGKFIYSERKLTVTSHPSGILAVCEFPKKYSRINLVLHILAALATRPHCDDAQLQIKHKDRWDFSNDTRKESSRNFSINTRDTNGMLENHLFLGHDKLECFSTGFRINDTTGRNLFSVNRNEVTIGAHALRIDGEGGAIFRESVQTPHVRAEPGRELRLESPTRQLQMTAARDINLQSRAGGIELSALEDVKLSTLDGSLRFESTKILMPNLRTAQAPIPGTAQNREHLHRVFQLCACSNGKLFLAAAHSICAGDDSTVCR